MIDHDGSHLQVLDPLQEILVVERKLPHWSQAATVTFVTFRTWDSIPKQVLDRFLAERWRWLRYHGIDPFAVHWRQHLERLGEQDVIEFRCKFSERWNTELDACYGECVLRQPELSRIVSDSLLHFDRDRYNLTDFIVMPNHVHLLAAFPDEEAMLQQCESWKRFTATKINRLLGRYGWFWQQDGFDHLVRTVEQYECLRRYIADNPRRARLSATEFVHFTKGNHSPSLSE